MLTGDDREATAGLGLGDQDRGWSAEARQTEWGVRGGTAGHGGRKFYGEGAWRLPPGRLHERLESRLRHAAFRRWVRGPAPHPRRCACSDCACCDEEDKEERETTALHILEVPRLDAPFGVPWQIGVMSGASSLGTPRMWSAAVSLSSSSSSQQAQQRG